MKVHFWGSRGSLPASLTAATIEMKIFKALQASRGVSLASDDAITHFIRRELPFAVRGAYGTSTSCVEIIAGDEYLVCDAGTGIRDFGNHLLAARSGQTAPAVIHLFVSHLHWDHLQGFPFFVPAYIPGHRIHIYGCHPGLRQAFEHQQHSVHFPVALRDMRAEISFHTLDVGQTSRIAGCAVRPFAQQHPGDSFGYLFEKDGKKLVYSTDSEHSADSASDSYPFSELIRDADLLIFDAQYALADALDTKEGWGHSSNIVGVELAVNAGVKRLCLFHMDSVCSDEALDGVLVETREYLRIYAGNDHPLQIDLAFDGLELEL